MKQRTSRHQNQKTRWYERALVAAFFDSRAEGGLLPALKNEGDWESLIRAASQELLLPGLRRRLNELSLEIPSDMDDFLAAVEDLNRERNAQLLDDARTIARVLNGIGIEPVLLKGAAYLVEGAWADPGCRYLCDLDLLVPDSVVARAAEALEREGYQPDASDRMARFRHHHAQLQRPRAADGSGSAPVELHHSLGHGISRSLLSGDEVLRDSRPLEWRSVHIRVPSPEHLITHLILHSQIHHTYSERMWPPLRAMHDLVMLNRHFGRRLDWGVVRDRFRVHGEESTLLLHLLQAQNTLGVPTPFGIKLGWIGRCRWIRRQVLNYWPGLRFADPIYLVASTLSRRVGFLKFVMSVPGGWKHATGTILRRGFYRRLFAEVSLR